MRRLVPRILAIGLTFACLALGAGRAALAQPGGTGTPIDAQKAFEEGKKAYNLGQFERAAELWTKAYELKPNPVFLYNIAQAHRQKRDFQRAIFFYKSYLRESPDAPNRADVETKIAEMQKLLDEQVKTGEGPPHNPLDPNRPEDQPKPEVKPEVKPTPEPEAPAKPGKVLKIAGLSVGGAGVAMVVLGVVFSMQSAGIASDLEDHVASGMPWSQELSDREASGKTKSTLGIVFLSAGGLAVLGGGTLFFLGMKKDRDAAASGERTAMQVLPSIGPRGASVSFRWKF